MSREEAIERLRGILTEAVEFENSVCYVTEEDREPLEMAIKALEQMPTKEEEALLQKWRDNRGISMEEFEDAMNTLDQEPCEDAISRAEAVRVASGYCHPANVAKELAKLPSVNLQPKTGHWIEIAQYSDGNHKIECSECESHIFDRGHANSFNVKNKYKYCPNCGARMVEPQESEPQETETWNGIHAQITAPKGTFERIFNDADDNDI